MLLGLRARLRLRDLACLFVLVAGAWLSFGAARALAVPDNAIRYVYDDAGRLAAVTDPATQTARYTWDRVGNVLSIQRVSSSTLSVLKANPGSGPAGTTVSIAGTGFSSVASQNTVKFNGTAATVTAATPTELTTTVPAGASTGTISVTVGASSASSAASFVVANPSGPGISAITPAVVAAGADLTASGSRFEAAAVDNVSFINGRAARVSAASASSLTMAMPYHAGSGPLTVRTPDGLTTGPDVFVAPTGSSVSEVEQTGRMSFGQAKTATINTPGSMALLLFDGTAGQRVALSFSQGFSGRLGVSLRAPDGTALAYPTYDGWFEPVMLPETGTYTVVVDGFTTGTGSMQLTAYDVPADITRTIVPSASGASESLSFDTPGQAAALKFTGQAGQRLAVQYANNSLSSLNQVLLAPDGTEVPATRSSFGGAFFQEPVTLPQSGTYTLSVDPAAATTGSVTVTSYDVPADSIQSVTSLSSAGVARQLTAGTPGQRVAIEFDGASGEGVSGTVSQGITNGNLQIEKPDGTRVGASTFVNNLERFRDTIGLPDPGRYRLVFDPYQAQTGTVTLTAYDASEIVRDTSIGGAAEQITIQAPGQNARLRFPAQAGQQITADFTSQTIPSWCGGLIAPDGTLNSQICWGTGARQLDFTVAADGTSALFIDPGRENLGAFTVAIKPKAAGAALRTTSRATPNRVTSRVTKRHGGLPTKRSQTAGTASRAVGRLERLHGAARRPGQRARLTPKPEPRTVGRPLGRRYRPRYPERWRPGKRARRGAFVTGREETPWQKLPDLAGRRGVTALSGKLLKLDGTPLAGVTLSLEGTKAVTRSDKTGRFVLEELPAGHHVLLVDGHTANRPGYRYGEHEIGVDLARQKTTQMAQTIWMTALDPSGDQPLHPDRETVLTTPQIPGLEIRIPADSNVTDASGKPLSKLNLTPVPVDRPPFALPAWIHVPTFFMVQPARAYLSKGAQIIYPNSLKRPAGTRVPFWNYDPDDRGWYIYGRGTVTRDEKQIVPDPDVRIWEFTGAMRGDGTPPPPDGPTAGGGTSGGDPVDLRSGLFVYQKTDLMLNGELPLGVTRTYRPGDTSGYGFGIGMTHLFDMRIWSSAVDTEQQGDLVLPDGGRVHLVRTNPGSPPNERRYDATGAPGKWDGAKLQATPGANASYPDWILTLRTKEQYVLNNMGELMAIRDRFGRQISVTRSGSAPYTFGPVTQMTGPDGRWIRFSYDSAMRIVEAYDSAGRTVDYGYDTQGRMTSVTDPEGRLTTYTYDAAGRMETVTDNRRIAYLTNAYDSDGRVSRQMLADGGVYQFAYTKDASGNVIKTTVTDPRNVIRIAEFDAAGFPTKDTYNAGGSAPLSFTYDREPTTNRLLAATDQSARKTAYRYDSAGNLAEVTRLAGTANAASTSFTYTPDFNQLASVTDPLNHATSYGYDALGRLRSMRDATDREWTFAYQGNAAQPESATDPAGKTTALSYVNGVLASTRDPLGRLSRRFTDAAGRSSALTDPLERRTKLSYDRSGLLKQTTAPDGSSTAFDYDANGNLVKLTDAKANLQSFTYDSMDRVATRTDGLLKVERYEYDYNGNLTKRTDRKNQVTSYRYDNLNRLLFVGYKTAGTTAKPTYESTLDLSYDGKGRLSQAVDSAGGTITRGYDDLDRLTSEAAPKGSIGYTYDLAGRRASMTVGGQPAVTYGYDDANRLTSLNRAGTTVAISHDTAGRRRTVTLPNGIAGTYSYDDAGQLTDLAYTNGTASVGDLHYAYDPTSRRTAVWGSLARTGLPATLGSATYNAANQRTAQDGKTLTYDLNGNLTKNNAASPAVTYTWNARDQLTALSRTGLSASFAYDAFGRRTSKTVSGTATGYHYDGGNIVQELSGTTPTANLLNGLALDERYARLGAASTKSFLTDALGSAVALTDTLGAITTSYTYDPFGVTTTTGAASDNPYQYTGRESDGTGLLYYRARYFSPFQQRFTSEDPAGLSAGDPNYYAYVGNSPTNLRDACGLVPAGPVGPGAGAGTAGRKGVGDGAGGYGGVGGGESGPPPTGGSGVGTGTGAGAGVGGGAGGGASGSGSGSGGGSGSGSGGGGSGAGGGGTTSSPGGGTSGGGGFGLRWSVCMEIAGFPMTSWGDLGTDCIECVSGASDPTGLVSPACVRCIVRRGPIFVQQAIRCAAQARSG